MSYKTHTSASSRMAAYRRAFRTSCAMGLALAIAGNGGMARAQSLLGTPTVVSGSADISTGPGSTDVYIYSDQAVINWDLPSSSAVSAPEIFQQAGTTATFQEGGSTTAPTFTVLNRILPYETVGANNVAVNRAVQFNGTVNSTFGGVQGGEVWFYSPSGIIAGPTASFNVGSLVLTTNDIDTTDGLYGTGNTIRFRGAASSLAPVEIRNGAVINAAGNGAYVAIVAPRIVQAGTVGADGHVALVAAEQADITFNVGLLDIVVTQGTTDPNGIVHTGSTGGPASVASDDAKVLSLIAIPKNTALTMLLSGSIGYEPAMSASDDGSSVVLSAGYGSYLDNGALAQNLGNINIGNTQFTSAVTGTATNAIDIAPAGGSVEFEQGALLTAFQSLSAIAGDGESIVGGQALFLRSNQGLTGGDITLRAEGGTTGGEISATGGLYLSANGFEDTLFPQSGGALAGTGGTITLAAAGGRIASDQISLEALGFGMAGMDTGVLGGDGTGGAITTSVSGGGSIATNYFSAEASGYGGYGDDAGGDGFGGSVSLLDQGGALDFGTVSLGATGWGGQSFGQTGNAQSGSVIVDITSGTKAWADLSAEANAEGGDPLSYGSLAGSAIGRPDAVRLHVGTGATLDIAGYADLAANAYARVGGAGNTGTAGGVNLLVDGGGTLRVGDTLNVTANASIDSDFISYNPQTSPALTGGRVNILADGGTINIHSLLAEANASGTGATDSAGIITGGTSIVGAAGGGTISTFAGNGPGFITVEAEAYGGNGSAPANAFGGTATLFAEDGRLDIDGSVQVSAMATSGDYTEYSYGTGFTAQGGTASIELRAGTAGTASLSAADISILADGNATGSTYSYTLYGDGGTGTGGTARLSVAAGALATDDLTIRSNGLGGVSSSFDSPVPLRSGDGFGGTASLVITGGTTTIANSLDLVARGHGGDASLLSGGGGNDGFGTPPLSGNGTGGLAEAQLSGGILSTARLTLDGSGVGSEGADDFTGFTMGGDGGNGTGGTARLGMPSGSTASLIAEDVSILGNGIGGQAGINEMGGSGNGGNGAGGSAGFALADGSFTLGATHIEAEGIGGGGATGGNGAGGTASFVLDDSLAGTATRSIASLSLSGNGVGGVSDTGPESTQTAGQVQLAANAGSAASGVSITGDFLASARGAVAPAGDGFTANIGGAAFTVGGNGTITTSRDVSMTIGAGGAFATTGSLSIFTPRTITATGLIRSGGDTTISADLGISMTDLGSGGLTYLSAPYGPVVISNDLRVTGPLLSVLGTSVDISSLGSLSFYDVTASTGSLSIETAGDLLLPYLSATGDVSLTSGGALNIGAPVTGGTIDLMAAGTLSVQDVSGSGNVRLTSIGGNLITTGLISGADVSLSSAGDLTSFTVAATGDLSLTSTAGSVSASTALEAASITISAAGNIGTLAVTSAGAVSMNSGGAINLNGAVSGTQILLAAGGALQVNANVVGTDITATSADIAIASGANIGARGITQAITLRNANSANRTYIGGAAQANAYQIDAAELTQLFADNSITLGAADGPLGSGADLVIGSLALAYGGNANIGSGGTLKVVAPGRIEVSGAVALTTSSAADRFSIDPSRIDIVTDTGSIIMTDGTGDLQGELELVGGTIAVASAATLAQIAGLTSQEAINDALGAAPATPNADGYLQAGSIVVNATDAFYIANTGATSDYADRRGFTANRLSITTGSAATHISINGVIVGADGLAVTGLDVAPYVSINGQPASRQGQFSRLSMINGCLAGTDCEFSQQNELTRTKSDIEVPLDPEGSTKPEYLYVLAIEQPEPDDLQPLVDEPVTGVGNDDLWGSSCGPASGGCPQGGNGQ